MLLFAKAEQEKHFCTAQQILEALCYVSADNNILV